MESVCRGNLTVGSNPTLSAKAMRLTGRGARVVDRGGLENRCTREGTVGSNPTLSAMSNGNRTGNGWIGGGLAHADERAALRAFRSLRAR